MSRAVLKRTPWPRLLGAAAAALVLCAPAMSPAAARASTAYQHGGIDDCETCHMNAHTWWTPTNEHCLTCHAGYQTVRAGDLCWTCHPPGQDMSWARSDAACLSACHLRGGMDFTHATHAGASAACTTCHALTPSAADGTGSVHHTIPTPRLDLVTRSAAAPGASVTLSGAKLSWAVIVRFGGVVAAFVVTSDTSITATVPATAVTGPVTVLSAGGSATSTGDFVVLRPEAPVPSALTLVLGRRTVAPERRLKLSGTLTPAGAAPRVRASAAGVTSRWATFRVRR